MKETKITKAERIKIFLKEYYFGYGIYFSIVRLIGGIIVLLFGLKLYNDELSKLGIGYAGFLILYGGYYILKPLLIILFEHKRFEELRFSFQLESGKMVFQNNDGMSEINYDAFKKIIKRKSYYIFRTSENKSIYLTIKDLNTDDKKILDSIIKT